MSHKTAVCICVHDDFYYLGATIASFTCGLPVFVYLSEVSWNGDVGDWHRAEKIALAAGAQVVSGQWTSEKDHRTAAYDQLRKDGFGYVLVPDGDEIIEPRLLDALLSIAQNGLADRVHIEWDTYFMDTEHVVRPREPFRPIMLGNLNGATYDHTREWSGGRQLLLDGSYDIVHHLSYAGPDERIRRKVTTWGHKDDVYDGWLENVWDRFPQDKLMRNVHPTHPQNYAMVEHIYTPPTLKRCLEIGRGFGDYNPSEGVEPHTNGFLEHASDTAKSKPSVSVVIPLCGGEDDIRICLDSLAKIQDLVSEVIVVDNASKDEAAKIAVSYDFVKLAEFGENRGFAAACNEGIRQATGEVVILLNSDTYVPGAGLVELLKSLDASGSIAAAGPYTNTAGYGQSLPVTYTSNATLDLFAEDFAARPVQDQETDMMVGFCMAIRKSALDEVGLLDESFGLGMFEDNDLCYRLRRQGYRLVLSGKSFVHHSGSKTLGRLQVDPYVLLQRNRARFMEKWRPDLEFGYASHLSGMGPAPIQFTPERKPETRLKEIANVAKRADISLCMIVRNEERVLGACLASAEPFFKEMIVVDTGSTDRTKEIALSHGAKVYDFPWTDSFSEARNQSLKHATGKWIFWMDADDTLPFRCGEELLAAALNAPKHIAGYVVPVRFVDDGPAGGVQVDHVKLFRNLKDVCFKFRIHEQILGSLKGPGREIARSAAYVLHSGYDTSEEGQARKRVRDRKLLKLDEKENPNHPFVAFNIGMTAHYTEDHKTAIKYLLRSIKLAEEGESHVRKAYALLAGSKLRSGKPDESEKTLEEGLARFPDDPELNFLYAQSKGRHGDLASARAHYDRVVNADIGSYFTSVDQGILTFKTLHNRAEVDLQLGNYHEAKAGWLSALDASPQFLVSAVTLFSAALSVADLATAREMLDRIQIAEGHGLNWTQMAVRYGELINGQAGANDLLVRAFESDPRAIEPRLEYARRLIAAGQDGAAAQQFHYLQQMGVAEAAYALGIIEFKNSRLKSALGWMTRALALNPGHEDTTKHIAMLEEMVTQKVARPSDRGDPPVGTSTNRFA